jgi:hypothetical protein
VNRSLEHVHTVRRSTRSSRGEGGIKTEDQPHALGGGGVVVRPAPNETPDALDLGHQSRPKIGAALAHDGQHDLAEH